MQNNSFFSKKIFSGLALSSLILTSCSPVNFSLNENIPAKSFGFIDWSSDRIYPEAVNTFSTKNKLKVDPRTDNEVLEQNKLMNNIQGKVSTTEGSNIVTGTDTFFTSELRVGDLIYLLSSKETHRIQAITSDTSLTLSGNAGKSVSDSDLEVTLRKNKRAKDFGSTSVYPAILTNGAGTADDLLFFTSDNSGGANFFAVNANNEIIFEQTFAGGFQGNSPAFSNKLVSGRRIMYLTGKDGKIYCLDTSGKMISSLSTNDSFRGSSVFVDSTNPDRDYLYAASVSGNIYRFKMDFSNPQTQNLSQEYALKIANTSFTSSPVLNNNSVFIGGENGVFYQLVPNSGEVSRSWNLTAYHNNGAGAIKGNPLFIGNIAFVPSGGYLFRIENSVVTQSPLLELKEGLNSSRQYYGSVFKNNYFPSGSITASPILNNGTNNIYIGNGNAVFEIDSSNLNTFQAGAKYCISISARLNSSGKGLRQNAGGNVALSNNKLVMVDVNDGGNSQPHLNYFTVPFPNNDGLERYFALNDFSAAGYSANGENSRVVADNDGNVYFSVNNGTLNLLRTP